MKVQGLNINLKTKHITIEITEQYMTLLPQTHEPSLHVHTLEFQTHFSLYSIPSKTNAIETTGQVLNVQNWFTNFQKQA